MVSTLLTNLVSYWKFDTNNATQPDSVGSNNLTVSGATFQAVGKINGDYDYDGSNDYMTRAVIANIGKTGTFSLAFWFKVDTTTGILTIVANANGASDRFALVIINDVLSAGIYNGSSYFVKKSGAFTDTSSYHLAIITFDGSSTFTLDLDNVALTGTTQPSATADINFTLGAATSMGGNFNNGRVDEGGYWDKVLSPAEKAELWNGGASNQWPFPITVTDNSIFHGMNF